MSTKQEIKHSGATFTPKDLADFLAEKILSNVSGYKLNVLDPACGEGELLVAIGESLTEAGTEFELTGYDANSHYLGIANERLSIFGKDKIKLVNDDFLHVVDINNQTTLDLFAKTKASINKSFDVVIANPPYVRTQILGADQAQDLAKKFGLKGRVDLYYPFLIAMTESLKEGGILGAITSNRFLFTKSGNSIRKYLSERYSILELLDLGDTKLFKAAVLPAIFVGKKGLRGMSSLPKFSKIYEELNGYSGPLTDVESVYDVINEEEAGYYSANGKRYKKTTGILKYSSNSDAPWGMLSTDESDWVSAIEGNTRFKVEDFFKVSVGIKTTADKVFIREEWNSLGHAKPEDKLLKDLISQENINAWGARENIHLKVLYPHYSENGVKKTIDLDEYPRAKEYLNRHEQVLKGRKYIVEAGREWFEIWVPHRPERWALPKLVFPDISATPRFYFDNGGKIVNGNCYWIVARSEEDVDKLLLIQGVANSKLMTKYHDLVFNNKLYSGRRRYLTQYVEKYPLPDPTSGIAGEIISIVKKLNGTADLQKVMELSGILEDKIGKAFGVQPAS